MAKKDKKKKDKKDDKGVEADVIAAVRGAFEKLGVSGESAASTRERTQAIVDDIAAAAGKVRNTLEDMRVLDEVSWSKVSKDKPEACFRVVPLLRVLRNGSQAACHVAE